MKCFNLFLNGDSDFFLIRVLCENFQSLMLTHHKSESGCVCAMYVRQ